MAAQCYKWMTYVTQLEFVVVETTVVPESDSL